MSDLKKITLTYVLRLCTINVHSAQLGWMYSVCESVRGEMNLHGGYAPVSQKRVVKHKVLVRKSKLKMLFSNVLNVLRPPRNR